MTSRETSAADFEIIRDPLWDNIRLEPLAVELMDTPAFQRLRYIRQLGHAFLVYPGATHTRFEHALGTYHLATRALGMLRSGDANTRADDATCRAVRIAALLHDIGHYPFSHALEEAGFIDHETLGVGRIRSGEIGECLRNAGGDALVEQVAALITGRSSSPLAGLVSGSLDLDKIDYLSRDARMCGVPYGTVDVDRLLASLVIVDCGAARGVGIQEKGVSALESLLFAKYQMYRNVYWHHAVRSATCMFKRAVRDAVDAGDLDTSQLADATDGSLMATLLAADRTGLAHALQHRRLYKRALDLPASEVDASLPAWLLADDPAAITRAEDDLARRWGWEPGTVLIDFPARASMLGVDLPLLTRSGSVERLTDEGRAGHLGLPHVGGELYRSARRLRVFTAAPRVVKLDEL